jgi:hypothetical protein
MAIFLDSIGEGKQMPGKILKITVDSLTRLDYADGNYDLIQVPNALPQYGQDKTQERR